MSGPIIFLSEDSFKLDFGSNYETVTVTPPLIFNSSGDQVGVSMFNSDTDNYKILYTSGHYGVTIVTIPAYSVIFTNENNVKFSNNITLDNFILRPVPEITFEFPNTSIPIDFSTGIRIRVNIERAPNMELPINLDNSLSVNVKTSEHLVYVSLLNKIFFVPDESNNVYDEWFQIIPNGSPNSILNQTYSLTIGSTPYVITPSVGANYNYTTINTYLPMIILNSEFINTMINNIWTRNPLYVKSELTPKDIYTFNIRSADDNVSFELMTHMDIFEVNSFGVLRSKGFPNLGVQSYDLVIRITNGLNEVIEAQIRVICYDIFSEFYFQSYMTDITLFRQLSIAVTAGENNINVYRKEVKTLEDTMQVIRQCLNFMIQQSINIEFKTNRNDNITLGTIFTYESQQDLLDFFVSKLPIMSTTSLLHGKLEVLSKSLFPFIKNFLKTFIMNPGRENTFKIETEYGNMIIKKW